MNVQLTLPSGEDITLLFNHNASMVIRYIIIEFTRRRTYLSAHVRLVSVTDMVETKSTCRPRYQMSNFVVSVVGVIPFKCLFITAEWSHCLTTTPQNLILLYQRNCSIFYLFLIDK